MVSHLIVWIVVNTTLYLFSTFFVLLRLFDRHRRNVFRPTDITTMVAFALSNFYYASAIFQAYVAYGPQTSDVTQAWGHWLFALSYTGVVPVTKMSVIFIFLELQPSKWHRIILWCLLVYCCIHVTAFLCFTFFGCIVVSPQFSWAALRRHGIQSGVMTKCVLQHEIILSNCISNAVAELILICLAVPFVVNLGAGVARKVGLLLAFMLGFFTVTATMIMGVYSAKGDAALQHAIVANANHYYYVGGTWSAAEVQFSLAIASILPSRAMILRFIASKLAALGLTRISSANPDGEPNHTDKLCWPYRKSQWPDIYIGQPLRRASDWTSKLGRYSVVHLKARVVCATMFKRRDKTEVTAPESQKVTAAVSQTFANLEAYDIDSSPSIGIHRCDSETIGPQDAKWGG